MKTDKLCEICGEPLSEEDFDNGFCSDEKLCGANARIKILQQKISSLEEFKTAVINKKITFPSPGTAEFEKHAAVEHDIWSHWMKYMFSVCKNTPSGTVSIPADLVSIWREQMETPYNILSEKEKNSDREILMRHLNVDNEK